MIPLSGFGIHKIRVVGYPDRVPPSAYLRDAFTVASSGYGILSLDGVVRDGDFERFFSEQHLQKKSDNFYGLENADVVIARNLILRFQDLRDPNTGLEYKRAAKAGILVEIEEREGIQEVYLDLARAGFPEECLELSEGITAFISRNSFRSNGIVQTVTNFLMEDRDENWDNTDMWLNFYSTVGNAYAEGIKSKKNIIVDPIFLQRFLTNPESIDSDELKRTLQSWKTRSIYENVMTILEETNFLGLPNVLLIHQDAAIQVFQQLKQKHPSMNVKYSFVFPTTPKNYMSCDFIPSNPSLWN